MPLFLSKRSDVAFTGFDIVETNINNHRKRFSDTDWRFEVHDIVTDEIKTSYDLIISRHTTQHLKTSDVVRVVRNFVKSSSKFLFTSSYPQTTVRIWWKANSKLLISCFSLTWSWMLTKVTDIVLSTSTWNLSISPLRSVSARMWTMIVSCCGTSPPSVYRSHSPSPSGARHTFNSYTCCDKSFLFIYIEK